MAEANTQDLVVRRCWVTGESKIILCQVDWHGQPNDYRIESILNEINKTSVFAHGFAVAAQLKGRQ